MLEFIANEIELHPLVNSIIPAIIGGRLNNPFIALSEI